MISGGSHSAALGWTVQKSRCQFCDTFTNNDAELSEHIASDIHVKNRNDFVAVQVERNKLLGKNEPLNLVQAFKLLGLKSTDCVASLAQKEFFAIKTTQQSAIADKFNWHLVKTLVLYETNKKGRECLKDKFNNDIFSMDPDKNDVDEDDDDNEEDEDDDDDQEEVEDEQMDGPANDQATFQVKNEPMDATMPNQDTSSDRPADSILLPDPSSSYIPQLAKIKVEPKD